MLKRRTKTFGLCIALTGTLTVLSPLQADAVGGNCSAWMEHGVGTTQGVGSCSSLHNDTKARVTLDIALIPDRYSKWFTDTGTIYRTQYWYAQVDKGFPRSARVDLRPR